ncbi:hypothetical protein ACIQ4I_12215 [Rummeliibacillus sp. NPDC094406]|uniref:hypothetical protein n=1 Tax=Rummeliibacillus sp. NPDC094406 TaxID=3364511 RepID=UPI003812FBB5
MTVTNEIEYIVDQIVITYCQFQKFNEKVFSDNFENYVSQLMTLTGLDREGALKYAVSFLAERNKVEGVA